MRYIRTSLRYFTSLSTMRSSASQLDLFDDHYVSINDIENKILFKTILEEYIKRKGDTDKEDYLPDYSLYLEIIHDDNLKYKFTKKSGSIDKMIIDLIWYAIEEHYNTRLFGKKEPEINPVSWENTIQTELLLIMNGKGKFRINGPSVHDNGYPRFNPTSSKALLPKKDIGTYRRNDL